MQLSFDVPGLQQADAPHSFRIERCVLGGWTSRDPAVIAAHAQELREHGIALPSTMPIYYRVGSSLLTQQPVIEVIGADSSGEVEIAILTDGNELYVSVMSDHTDRELEKHSIALSKQVCPKPVATQAWRYAEVAAHWDALVMRSWIQEDGQRVLYQESALAPLLRPDALVLDCFGDAGLPQDVLLTGGTVGAIGGMRPAGQFAFELVDPVLGRTIAHAYTLSVLPDIA